jgi:hypothetical protein
MAYTVLQYASVDVAGAPREPANKTTVSQALGAALKLDLTTIYAVVIPDANMYFRISPDSQAATAAFTKYLAAAPIGFPVTKGQDTYLYGITAP